jgi:hypothetical protein
MGAINTLVPDVRAAIPELTSSVAERQLLRAARIFCEDSRSWRVDITVSVTANVATVNLAGLLPANTELVDIISVKNSGGGQPVAASTYIWLDQNTSNWRGETDLNAKWYILDGNNTIRFVPVPAETTASLYNIRVAVKPKLTATAVDDVVLNKYDETLVNGALGRLYLIPRKPWTDANLAQFHEGLFRAAIPAARSEAADEFQTGVRRKVKYGGI